jgi:flagellar basal-body rod modification protein FlgD
MASAISPITSTTNTSSGSSSSTGLGGTAPSEQMFLQLLVAQLQNQDPLNPTDSTQFVSQLAQFSELEQVMAIRSDIESGKASLTTTPTTTNPAATEPTDATQSNSSTGQTSPTTAAA